MVAKKPTSIVYVYAHRCARAPLRDELKWSLRSLSNIKGAIDVIVCGDPPEWYTGRKVVMEPLGEHYKDIAAKFTAITESPFVSDDFILWMDDTIAWNPIELGDVAIPRSTDGSVKCHSKISWMRHVRPTLELCKSLGFGAVDASTHWPYPFTKTKLRETIERFKAAERKVCLETAYVNMHAQDTKPLGNDFLRHRSLCEIPDTVKIFNYIAMTPELRAALAERFPNRSKWESD